eukprot:CAMPEP_0182490442 /NCGR_PEP_ID=MMETSP1321-20130603/296_1 /TAXON_ID=91990 /ORGANISM="Bolidomonas sp., Strain RCC1657" /LENGTH=789 /DNA_ID=CAMNT_0024692615 /DNA_START=6 /DNA_END=2375 /DNA_ORIENTATION=-
MAHEVRNEEMDRLIPIVNKLQDAFAIMGGTAPIDLPQIAVLGGQSSGKSSVLENVVGKSFLPRGSGIVTRRPLILQLFHEPSGEWGEFLHKPGEKFYDFDMICEEIEADTARICGKNKGLSTKPINLRVYSPDVLNLTLIDLPGATKVAVGDQPSDIGKQIESMIKFYVSKPNCLILAVTAANTDLANSDAIAIAKEVDPKGERTLGVMTKLDLMDRGTDARGIFTGESQDVPLLKMGYIGVVNRSQADINERKTIQGARDAENAFFEGHPGYADIADRLGTAYLVKKCSNMLLKHIQRVMPELTADLNKLTASKRKELADIGEEDPRRTRMDITEVILSFSDQFKNSIDGKLGENQDLVTELTGGARIEGIFNDVYAPAISEIDILEQLGADEVQTLIRNVSGLGGSLFIPNAAFIALVESNIGRLLDPSLQCVQLVYSELLNIVSDLSSSIPAIDKYPALKTSIIEATNTILREQYMPTADHVKTVVSMEEARVNMHHPDFIGHRENFGKFTQEVEEQCAIGPPPPPPRTGNKAVILEGWVSKKGGGSIVLWQKRYIMLKKDGILSYYKMEGDQEPLGDIVIGGCIVERADALIGKRYAFQLYHRTNDIGKTFFFTCESEQEANDWVSILKEECAKPPMEPETEEDLLASAAMGGRRGSQDGDEEEVVPDTRKRGLTERIHESIHQELGMREKIECEILFRLLISYFEIVKKNVSDMIPKAISYLLIDKLKVKLTSYLINELDSEAKIKQLSAVAPEIAEKRVKLKKTLGLLDDSMQILQDLSHTSF